MTVASRWGLRRGTPWGLAGLLVLAALLAGCGAGDEAPPPGAVARIGDQWVEKEAFDLYLRRTIGAEADELGSDVLSLLLDQFLEEEQLARLAVDRGLASAEDSRRRAVDQLLRSAESPEPTDAEVESYYHAHVDEFERPERVRLRQILVDDRATAERALEALHGGEDFVEVARSFSRDPDADSGGEQGELSREDLPPAFVDPIFRLREGEVSDIVEAEYGFHIFQVTAKLPAEVVPLAEVEDEIRQTLAGESADRRLAELLDEARDRYNTVVYEKNLPFSYRGRYAKEDA